MLSARFTATIVLPQPAVGEVIASERQLFWSSSRTSLVRSMSKVTCAGSALV
jgi:hypothetical protein